MAIEKFLDASTGHITAGDKILLEEDFDSFPTRVIPHEFGWWVNVPVKEDYDEEENPFIEMRAQGYSDAFINFINLAADSGCWWINFDADGDRLESFEMFS